MTTRTGHFNLFPIFDFATDHVMMPSSANKATQADYSKLINNTISDVPDAPGWYLWGRLNDMGWWETVYLGKAGKKKTSSLHTRLYDELREECIAFWAEVYGREPMIKQHTKQPNSQKYGPPTRSLRKSGSRIVIWIAVDDDISEDEIKRQEDLLIKIYRPTHNAARWNQDAKHDENTEYIEQAIENELRSLITPKQ
jgi:hypothetical protein